jgi:hypothetical protein
METKRERLPNSWRGSSWERRSLGGGGDGLGFGVGERRLILFGGWARGALVLAAFLPAGLHAQEFRVSLSQGYSSIEEVGLPRGWGGGVRLFLPRGIGVGIEHDRFTSSPRVRGLTCNPGEVACEEERIAYDTEVSATSFLVMLGGQGDDWGFRLGIGRSAGAATGRGVGLDSGREVTLPPADEGAGSLAWSRGSDGSVFVLELLRRLPVPGPFPLRVYTGYRRHHTEMVGCVTGTPSPLCGRHPFTEFQIGLNLELWSAR